MDFTSFISRYQKVPVVKYPSSVTENPKVSVCVQTYQHSNFIRECLDGILNQVTDFPIEILLGEDESEDGTREICIEYVDTHPEKIRLFLHSRKNNIKIGGKPTGRFNVLYNLFSAKGKYIALCEGDDYWTDPLKLQKQVDFLEANPEYFFCGHDVAVRNEKSNSIIDTFKLNKNVITLTDTVFGPPVHTSSWVFRNGLKIPKGFSKLVAGDDAMMCYLASKGKGYSINETMGVYRLSDSGTWSSLFQSEKDYRTLIIQLWTITNFPVRLLDQSKQIYSLVKKIENYKSLFSSNFNAKQKSIAVVSITFFRVSIFKSYFRNFLITINVRVKRQIRILLKKYNG